MENRRISCTFFRWEKEIYGTDRKADNRQRTVSAYQKENRKNYLQCQTAHCGRRKPHFDFGVIASPIVPYRNLPQILSGMTADCCSLV